MNNKINPYEVNPSAADAPPSDKSLSLALIFLNTLKRQVGTEAQVSYLQYANQCMQSGTHAFPRENVTYTAKDGSTVTEAELFKIAAAKERRVPRRHFLSFLVVGSAFIFGVNKLLYAATKPLDSKEKNSELEQDFGKTLNLPVELGISSENAISLITAIGGSLMLYAINSKMRYPNHSSSPEAMQIAEHFDHIDPTNAIHTKAVIASRENDSSPQPPAL